MSDAESRKKYDQYGDDWKRAEEFESRHGSQGAGRTYTWSDEDDFDTDPFAGFEDLFRKNQRRRTETASRPQRLELDIEVTLEEAYLGSKRTVTITQGGRERRIEVDIPPGVDTGSVVKVRPSANQDLRLKMIVEPHPRFPATWRRSVLGRNGAARRRRAGRGGRDRDDKQAKGQLKIPTGSQNGQRIRLKGKGMPKTGIAGQEGRPLRGGASRVMPEHIGNEERKLFERLRVLRTGKG